MREFSTGATRDSADWKFDLKGFLSARVPQLFGAYMHFHRKQADGKLRDSDNWKKGIPMPVLEESLVRHFWEWAGAREKQKDRDQIEGVASSPKYDPYGSLHAALGMYFNLQGWLHEMSRDMENRGIDFREVIAQQAEQIREEEKRLAEGSKVRPLTDDLYGPKAAPGLGNYNPGLFRPEPAEPYHGALKPRDDGAYVDGWPVINPPSSPHEVS